MRPIINERHLEMKYRASTLDILKELRKREALDEEYTKLLHQLEAKEKGLKIVLDRLKKFGKDHWFYVADLSLDPNNKLNCDLVLLTLAGMHTFEIYHQEGFFELDGDEGYMNLEKMDVHPIRKTRDVLSQIKDSAYMHSVPLNIQGAAVFSNPDTQMMIRDTVKDIDIVTADQLTTYIKKIRKDEKRYKGRPMITPMYLSWIGRIDRHHPRLALNIPAELKKQARKGILCCHCGSFDIRLGDPYISCACGMHESLEEATVRTICEYGVLNNDKDLEVPALLNFFDDQISEETLCKYLEKHFMGVN